MEDILTAAHASDSINLLQLLKNAGFNCHYKIEESAITFNCYYIENRLEVIEFADEPQAASK